MGIFGIKKRKYNRSTGWKVYSKQPTQKLAQGDANKLKKEGYAFRITRNKSTGKYTVRYKPI